MSWSQMSIFYFLVWVVVNSVILGDCFFIVLCMCGLVCRLQGEVKTKSSKAGDQ